MTEEQIRELFERQNALERTVAEHIAESRVIRENAEKMRSEDRQHHDNQYFNVMNSLEKLDMNFTKSIDKLAAKHSERHKTVNENVQELMFENWQQKGAWRAVRRWLLVTSLAASIGGLFGSVVTHVVTHFSPAQEDAAVEVEGQR